MKKEWICEICNTVFELKRDLIEDLEAHYDNAELDMQIAEAELNMLGIKEW